MLTATTNVRARTMVPSPLRNTGRAAPGTIWLQHISIATVLMVLFASVCYPQTPTTTRDREAPDFRVEVWGYIVADFSTRVWAYFELRSRLEKGPPALTVTEDPAQIRSAPNSLSQKRSALHAQGPNRGRSSRRRLVLSSAKFSSSK